MTGFEAYQPGLWMDESRVMLKAKTLRASRKPEVKRSLAWKSRFPSSMLKMSVAAAVSVVLFEIGAASNIEALGSQMIAKVDPLEGRADPALSPLTDVNRSFNQLFEKFRDGEKLIPSDHVRGLALKAVVRKGEDVDIDAWARSIADQVKDADD